MVRSPSRPASSVHEGSRAREVELGRAEIRVARHLLQGRGGALHFQPVQVKRHGEHRSLSHVNQMTTWQVTGEHACMLEYSLPPVVPERHDRDFGFVVVSEGNAGVEKHSLASRQNLRPAMGILFRTQIRDRDGLSSLRGNL